jgi:hypothetical protein
MPRRFLALNLALAAVATLLTVYIVRQFVAPMPLPVGGRKAAAPAGASATAEVPRPPAGAYGVVAAKNLFSPTRTEGPTGPAVAAAPLVKPNLFGVVVRESGSIAYLEDPTTKRVAGYRVGDRILGGTVQTIKADSVVIEGSGVSMDVRLRDPGKPRAQPAAVGAAPQPSVAPALPGMIPPAATPSVTPPPQVAQPPTTQPGLPPGMVGMPGMPGVVPQPGQPPVVVPGQPPGVTIPGRRPLPPNLMRRLPPGMGDAPQQ